jgi:Uma2 family endonuclease
MQERVDEVSYYYDLHPTQEDLMGEPAVHAALVHYLVDVLKWLLRGELCALYENLNFYQTPNPREYPVAPDLVVIKGVPPQEIRHWRVGRSGPTPQVVLEILSEETWHKDLQEKPRTYARMGVQEYYAYDPHTPPLRRATSQRLFGWQLASQQATMHPLVLPPERALWSHHLDSFLVPDGSWLRLYDRQGQLRLTGEEARAQQAHIEARRAEVEARRAETEAQRARALAEKLRSLGIDPDQI